MKWCTELDVDLDPNWSFPDCNSSSNLPMALKWCTKFDVVQKRCPIVFQGHPSNLKVTRAKNRWFGSNLSKITRPVAAIKSLRFALLASCFVISRRTWSKAIQKFLLWLRQLRFWRVWQGVRQRPWPLWFWERLSQKMISIHLVVAAVTVMMVSAGVRVCVRVLACEWDRQTEREKKMYCFVMDLNCIID